jgi:hypothetical protein
LLKPLKGIEHLWFERHSFLKLFLFFLAERTHNLENGKKLVAFILSHEHWTQGGQLSHDARNGPDIDRY